MLSNIASKRCASHSRWPVAMRSLMNRGSNFGLRNNSSKLVNLPVAIFINPVDRFLRK